MATPAQRLRAIHLYRHSLKNVISWAVRREIFWEEAKRIRAEFDRHADASEPRAVEGILSRGEKQLWNAAHPDPYIVPYAYGGSMYQRNPPHPEMRQVLDFGREGH